MIWNSVSGGRRLGSPLYSGLPNVSSSCFVTGNVQAVWNRERWPSAIRVMIFGGGRLGVHQEWRSKKAREACRCTVKCHEGNEFATLGAFGTILGSIRSGGLRQDRFAPGWSSATRVMTLGLWDPLWTILGPIWSGVSRLGRLVLFVFACQEGDDFRIVGPLRTILGPIWNGFPKSRGLLSRLKVPRG